MNKGLIYLFTLILVGLCLLSAKQTSYWRNGGTLFERELILKPDHGMAAINAGMYYQNKLNYPIAYKYYQIAIDSQQSSFYGHMFKGFLLQKEGRNELAIEQYLLASKFKYLSSQQYLKELFENLSWLLFTKERYEEARLSAEKGKLFISEHDYLDNIINDVVLKLDYLD